MDAVSRRILNRASVIAKLASELAEAQEKLLQAESYRRVTAHLIATRTDGDCGDIDGMGIQDLLAQEGILEMVEAAESCGDGCQCAEFGFPAQCYRLTATGKAARGAHEEKLDS